MRRTIATAAAVLTLAAPLACRRPNLESTGGGYGSAAAAADTGAAETGTPDAGATEGAGTDSTASER